MKIFLSAIENAVCAKNSYPVARYMVDNGVRMKYNLMSYFYIKNQIELARFVRENTDEILIDSGAFSFQKGTKVSWEEYTYSYAKFIKEFDTENVVGYFEMDADNIIGYEKVKALRNILLSESGHPEKIIPVWHSNRGITEFINLCEQKRGGIVAITGSKNNDIQDDQYLMFLKKAKEYDCKLHCLGMTRKKILDVVPFDYVDSSSWAMQSIFGRVDGKKVTKDMSHNRYGDIFVANYLASMEIQKKYYQKWKTVCLD